MTCRYRRRSTRRIIGVQDVAEARIALDRLRRNVPGGQTCSFGLATWDGVEPLADCLARADEALYRAKVSGRNRISD